MIRGTRHLFGEEAKVFQRIINILKNTVEDCGYSPFIPSLLAEQELFQDNVDKIYFFKDKGNRDICLIPEITAVVRKIYNESWAKTEPKPLRLYYLSRCYRYDRPQRGRYREFWQFGIEILGMSTGDKEEALELLKNCLYKVGLNNYRLNPIVKRGLGYYIEDGFEAEVDSLGAQKQIAGGGRYKEGIGWAIGVDRLLIALDNTK